MRYFLSLFLLLSMLAAGCRSLDPVLNYVQPDEQPAGAAPAAPAVQVQPAPAGYTRAEASRYYEAQIEAQKVAVPRKQKNSNNTTVEQTIQTTNIWHLVIAAGGGLLLGFLATAAFFVVKLSPRL